MSKLNEATRAALDAIALSEYRLLAFHSAIRGLNQRNQPEPLRNAITTVHDALVTEELEAYRNLLMWSTFLGGEVQEQAKRRAYKRFLDHRYEVMHYLSIDGTAPGAYWDEEFKAFRAELDALKPKED